MNTIKCGRVVFELRDGDQIMDNGACLQLVSRRVGTGWNKSAPLVSKAEFKKFKNLIGIIVSDHGHYKLYTLANQPLISDN